MILISGMETVNLVYDDENELLCFAVSGMMKDNGTIRCLIRYDTVDLDTIADRGALAFEI